MVVGRRDPDCLGWRHVLLFVSGLGGFGCQDGAKAVQRADTRSAEQQETTVVDELSKALGVELCMTGKGVGSIILQRSWEAKAVRRRTALFVLTAAPGNRTT